MEYTSTAADTALRSDVNNEHMSSGEHDEFRQLIPVKHIHPAVTEGAPTYPVRVFNGKESELDSDVSLICHDERNTIRLEVRQEHSEKQSKQTSDEKRTNSDYSYYDNAPDGGWGWMVTFSAFMISFIADGIMFSFGVFFSDLTDHFKSSKSLTSWVYSVLNGTFLGIGPIASVLVSTFGSRKVAIFGGFLAAMAFLASTWSPNVWIMIVLYGVLAGSGLCFLYFPPIVTVGHYFNKKRALATGIAICGSGIGGFVLPPLCEFLIKQYTWRGAVWIMSAIVLNGIPMAALLRPLEGPGPKDRQKRMDDKGETENEQACNVSSMFDFNLLRSYTFLVYVCSCFVCMLGFYIPFAFIPDLVLTFNMTSQQGAMLLSIIGILNTVGRVVVGWVADRPWADVLLINSVSLMIGGVATMFVPLYKTFPIAGTYCGVFGISFAVFTLLRPIILVELLGIEQLTSSFGLVTMCQGIAVLIGAPIAGALLDRFGNFKGPFYMAGTAMALSGLICLPLRRIRRWESNVDGTSRRNVDYTSVQGNTMGKNHSTESSKVTIA